MTDNQRTLRAVSWRELCPWLIIFRAFRQAVRVPVLALATVAVLLTPIGWRISESLFLTEDRIALEALYQDRDAVGIPARWPGGVRSRPVADELQSIDLATPVYERAASQIASVFHGAVAPFRRMFDPRASVAEFAFFLLGGLWTLAIWALFGGAITRMAVVPLACDQSIDLRAALRHAVRKFPTYFLAPLFPLLGVVLFGAGLAAFGLLLRGGGIGVLIAGALWFLVLLGGLAMAYISLGLLFGWPLMWITASAEQDTDFFESVSRAYSYTRQAPLQYLFYAIVAVLFGGLCWLLAEFFTEATIQLGDWGVSWGAGREIVTQVRAATTLSDDQLADELPPRIRTGVQMVAAWTAFAHSVTTAFAFSYFWCAYCAIYLLLRYDVDRREMDEVWFAQENAGLTNAPPPLSITSPPGNAPSINDTE